MAAHSTVSVASQTFSTAPRVHRALTAHIEQRILLWLAERMPAFLTPDHLTLLGFVAQLGAGTFYALACYDARWLMVVNLCLALNWFGDSLDGTLARVRRQQRPRYGFYVDHVTDIAGSVALMAGLGCSGYLHWPVAVAMLVAFLLLAAESFLATYTLNSFQLSAGVFGPTELRLLLIVGNFALLHSRWSMLFGHRLLLFDLSGAIGAVSMAVAFVVVALRHIVALYRAEPLAAGPQRHGNRHGA